MINEYYFQMGPEFSLLLKKSILDLKSSEIPLVIREGNSYWDLNTWYNFLKYECNLQEDKRHFGYEETLSISDWWEISYQPEKASSYAYSKTRQPLHTDNAWFEDAAEINFFVMNKQAVKGGEQNIYPISRLISDLQTDSPCLWEDLTSTKVTIKKGDSDLENNTTILSKKGDIYKVHWNYYRTIKNSKHISSMCEAFFNFLKKKESSSSVEQIYCNSGDCFAFNDSLLLHGRNSFSATGFKERVLFQSMWKLQV